MRKVAWSYCPTGITLVHTQTCKTPRYHDTIILKVLNKLHYFDGFVQDCINLSALAMQGVTANLYSTITVLHWPICVSIHNVTHWGWDKMVNILQIFKCICLNEKFHTLIKISLKFDPRGPLNNKLLLVQVQYSGNGLVPHRQQVITWSMDDPADWCN